MTIIKFRSASRSLSTAYRSFTFLCEGELHLTESVCPKDFVGELEYWGLSALYLEPCCAYTLQRASWLLPVVDHGVDKDDQVYGCHEYNLYMG